MIEFGKSLRSARETKGYTIGQLAEQTKLLPSMIEALEREDFSAIVAPIYGRGFVRLYCEAVGLDPKPFIDEFMEIMNGNRASTIRERPVQVQTPPAPEPDDSQPPAPEPPVPDSAPEQNILSALDDLPPASMPADTHPQEQELSRYATPFRANRQQTDLTALWRVGTLAGAALLVLVLIVFGIRSLYRATSSAPETTQEQPVAPAAPVAPVAPVAPADETPRTPQKIPSLYID